MCSSIRHMQVSKCVCFMFLRGASEKLGVGVLLQDMGGVRHAEDPVSHEKRVIVEQGEIREERPPRPAQIVNTT